MKVLNNVLNSVSELEQKRFLVRIFLCSLVLQIVIVFVIANFHHPMTWENGEIADNIVAGRGFSISFLGGPIAPTSWQAPFYPYLLSGFYLTIGKNSVSFMIIELIQVVVSSLVPIFIYKAARLIFDARVAAVSAILLVPYPLLLWYTTRVHHTVFIFLAISVLFYQFLKAGISGRTKDFAAIGVTFGLSLLIDPVILMVGVSFFLWTMMKRGMSVALKKFLLVGIIAAAIIGPWTVRNYSVMGRLMLIKDSFGKEFWMGNNSHATGTGFAKGGDEEVTEKYPPKSLIGLQNDPEVIKNQLMLNEALRWIEANPVRFLLLTAKKVYYFWWYPPLSLVRHIDGGESVKYDLIKRAYWAFFLLFLAYGLFKGIRLNNEFIWTVLFIMLTYTAVYSLTHTGQVRFRGVIEPVMMIYVSYGFLDFLKKIKVIE